jgi:hypothetical protein
VTKSWFKNNFLRLKKAPKSFRETGKKLTLSRKVNFKLKALFAV